MPSFKHALARQQHLFLQRAADLAEMETAYEELADLHRQRLQDLSAGRRIDDATRGRSTRGDASSALWTARCGTVSRTEYSSGSRP